MRIVRCNSAKTLGGCSLSCKAVWAWRGMTCQVQWDTASSILVFRQISKAWSATQFCAEWLIHATFIPILPSNELHPSFGKVLTHATQVMLQQQQQSVGNPAVKP